MLFLDVGLHPSLITYICIINVLFTEEVSNVQVVSFIHWDINKWDHVVIRNLIHPIVVNATITIRLSLFTTTTTTTDNLNAS